MSDVKNQKISTRAKKSASRLAAVQALYQWKMTHGDPAVIFHEFLELRRGAEIDGDEYIKFNIDLFRDILMGVVREEKILTPIVDAHYQESANEYHLGILFHLILEAAVYEILYHHDLHENIIIAEYISVLGALFPEKESKVGHAMLDKIVKKLRPETARI